MKKTVTPGDIVGLIIILIGLTGGVINLTKFIKTTKKAGDTAGERYFVYTIWGWIWAYTSWMGTLIALRL